MLSDRLEAKIKLFAEIYTKCYALATQINSSNARYIANELFRETAKDMRSEFISRLQLGTNEDKEVSDNKPLGTERDADLKSLHDELVKDKPEMIILENAKPATDKQRHALHKFGIEQVPENLGLKEAGEILNILVLHSKEGDHDAIADLVQKFNKEWA